MRSKVKMNGDPKNTIKKLEKINKRFESGSDTVKVGLPKDSNPYPDGTSVIMVGSVHEFGSPKLGVPQRSFLREGVKENKKNYAFMSKRLSMKILSGKITKKKALEILGLQGQKDVVDKITRLKTPGLKYRKGNPLIDTGHLRQSITYEVK